MDDKPNFPQSYCCTVGATLKTGDGDIVWDYRPSDEWGCNETVGMCEYILAISPILSYPIFLRVAQYFQCTYFHVPSRWISDCKLHESKMNRSVVPSDLNCRLLIVSHKGSYCTRE